MSYKCSNVHQNQLKQSLKESGEASANFKKVLMNQYDKLHDAENLVEVLTLMKLVVRLLHLDG
jgi:hypothetical protein